jgi:sodium/bile acid cotransporter 7
MIPLLAKWWFLIGLALMLVGGFIFCQPIDRFMNDDLPSHWRDIVMALVLFLTALPVDSSLMWKAVRQPQAALLAIGINFGLLPLMCLVIAPWLREDLGFGLMVAAAVPSTIASAAVWTRVAGGNDGVALQVTMATNLLCFVVTPAWLILATGEHVEIDRAAVMQKLAFLAVLPTFAAQLARVIRPLARLASSKKQLLGTVGQIGILSMVLDGGVRAGLELTVFGKTLSLLDLLLMLAAVIAVHCSMLWAGHALGRLIGLDRPDRIGVGFSGSQKTLMLGLNLAGAHFGGLAMLPMIAYHISQLSIDAVVADRLRQVGETATGD